MTSARELLADRLSDLAEHAEEDGVVASPESLRHAMALAEDLGVGRPGSARPSLFLRDDGSYRLLWSTPMGAVPARQIGVRMSGDGIAHCVVSDDTATCGLAGLVMPAADVPRMIRERGLDDLLRD